MAEVLPVSPPRCRSCLAEIAAGLLVCPRCQALVHRSELERLQAEATAAEAALDPSRAIAAWRRALELLPPGTGQYGSVARKVEALSRSIDAGPAPAAALPAPATRSRNRKGALGAALALGFLLFKFKGVLFLLLGKVKFLLLGFKQLTTLGSMVLAFGVYWTLYGWPFALGLVLSIYIHEIGHVYALSRFGIRASAPMFIPGFGAYVRMEQYPSSPREDARVGLAGPMWGLAAALAALGLGVGLGLPVLLAISKVGAWINLFNLLPVWQLDGGRGFRALSRPQRWLAVLALAVAFFATREGLLLLLLILAVIRAWSRDAPPEGDRTALGEYALLAIALAWLARLPHAALAGAH